MAYKKVGKMVKKAGRKVGQALTTRYAKGGKVNMGRVIRDVALVKRMLNAEKKFLAVNLLGQVFGQTLGNTAGFHSNDITPIPAIGSGSYQRNGQSIKICSFHMTAQVIQQSAATQGVNYKMFIYKIAGDPEPTPATFVNEQWATNQFVGGGGQIVDYNSQINPNRFAEAKLIYFKSFRIAPDNNTGQTGFKTLNLGGKIQHHIRYDGDSQNITQGQLILVILADSGNCSPVVSSTLSNIPVQAVNTGCTLNYNIRWYYYDN